MIGWQEYTRQTRVDFEACKVLYSSGDYGNAAYHLQQCVEKSVKTIFYQSKSVKPRKSHLPLSPVMELQVAFDRIHSMSNGHGISFQRSQTQDNQDMYIYQCRELLYLLGEETSTSDRKTKKRRERSKELERAKIALWKNSLGILLDPVDEKFFQNIPPSDLITEYL